MLSRALWVWRVSLRSFVFWTCPRTLSDRQFRATHLDGSLLNAERVGHGLCVGRHGWVLVSGQTIVTSSIQADCHCQTRLKSILPDQTKLGDILVASLVKFCDAKREHWCPSVPSFSLFPRPTPEKLLGAVCPFNPVSNCIRPTQSYRKGRSRQ